MLDGCIAHAHYQNTPIFLDQKSTEIKLDFEISYALERRVGPLGEKWRDIAMERELVVKTALAVT